MSYLDKYKTFIDFDKNKTERDLLIQEERENFEEYLNTAPNHYLLNEYKDIQNKIECTLQDSRFDDKKYDDEKVLCVRYNENLNMGESITIEDNNYIIVFEEKNTLKSHKTFLIRPQTQILVFLNSKGDECYQPCIIEDATKYSNGIFENKNIQVGDTRQQLIVQKNPNTEEFYIGKRLLIDKIHAYKISDIKPSSPRGLIYMILEQTEIHHGIDNLDLLIADYYGNAHEYRIEILNKNLILTTNDTYRLQVNVYDKQTKIDNPELTFDVYNKEIASIENGIITGLKEGSTDIVVRFKDITDTINVQVVTQQIPVNNYSCEIVGRDTMTLDRTREYEVKFYNNGQETSDVATWKIVDENNNISDYANIVNSSSNKCTVHTTSKWIFNDNNCKYFYLYCEGTQGQSCKKQIEVTSY